MNKRTLDSVSANAFHEMVHVAINKPQVPTRSPTTVKPHKLDGVAAPNQLPAMGVMKEATYDKDQGVPLLADTASTAELNVHDDVKFIYLHCMIVKLSLTNTVPLSWPDE